MILFKKRLVSERPCKTEGCKSSIYYLEGEGWYCIKKDHPQGKYGSDNDNGWNNPVKMMTELGVQSCGNKTDKPVEKCECDWCTMLCICADKSSGPSVEE